MLPFSLVEEPEFIDLCKELDPRYEVPGRKHFSNIAIPRKYSEVKAGVMSELKEAKSISCTTDGWSSNNTTPYLSLTAHFITPSWQLRCYCLKTMYMPDSHTGENIAAMIRNILAEYDLHISDVTSMTTDSAANMKKACSELGVVRLPCFGHVLHNSINNAVKGEDKTVDMVKNCRNIVTAVTSSYKQRSGLSKCQKEAGLKVKNLVGEVSTRWGSKYAMVDTIYTNRRAIQSLLINDRKLAKLNPTWEQLCLMEMFVETLKPLSSLTDAMSSESTVSVSNMYPLLLHLKRICAEEVTFKDHTPDPEIVSLAQRIRARVWTYISERYETDEPLMRLLKLCAFLDPRFQSSSENAVAIEQVIVEVVALECTELGETEDRDPVMAAPSSPSQSEPQSSTSLMDLLIKEQQNNQVGVDGADDADSRARKEVEYYLQIAKSMITASDELTTWWGSKGKQFPMLQRLAKKYLTVNATSTASERLFSCAGNIASSKRNCLKPEKLDMLTCLAFNLRNWKK